LPVGSLASHKHSLLQLLKELEFQARRLPQAVETLSNERPFLLRNLSIIILVLMRV
jgi:hypothetical protein